MAPLITEAQFVALEVLLSAETPRVKDGWSSNDVLFDNLARWCGWKVSGNGSGWWAAQWVLAALVRRGYVEVHAAYGEQIRVTEAGRQVWERVRSAEDRAVMTRLAAITPRGWHEPVSGDGRQHYFVRGVSLCGEFMLAAAFGNPSALPRCDACYSVHKGER